MLHERKGQLAKGYRECCREAFTAEYVVHVHRLYNTTELAGYSRCSVYVCMPFRRWTETRYTYFPPIYCMILHMHPSRPAGHDGENRWHALAYIWATEEQSASGWSSKFTRISGPWRRPGRIPSLNSFTFNRPPVSFDSFFFNFKHRCVNLRTGPTHHLHHRRVLFSRERACAIVYK